MASREEVVVNERLRILSLIESGEISVEEGVRLMEELSEPESSAEDRPQPPMEADPRPVPNLEPESRSTAETLHGPLVGIVWRVVFGSGVAVLAGGGLLLARAYGREGTPGLVWGWVLFTLGVLVIALGWWLRQARWLTLRVREAGGRAFAIGLPLPLGLVVWALRVAKPFVPQLEEMGVDQLVLGMRDELAKGHPFVVNVDEGEGGNRVEICFR
jgi:hypothetical protein